MLYKRLQPFIGSILAFILISVSGCDQSSSEEITGVTGSYSSSSRTALDWDGRYQGRLPCADCEAIELDVTLTPSGEYRLKTRYLGKQDEPLITNGTFQWDATGQIIQLNGEQQDSPAFFVGENILWFLDQNKQRINGDLAEQYQLHKHLPNPNNGELFSNLENGRWLLSTLPDVQTSQPLADAYVTFTVAAQTIAGFSGCNRFFGQWQSEDVITDGARFALRFNQMGMTKMACPDHALEDGLISRLNQTRFAQLRESELYFFDEVGQVMAAFSQQGD